jgi:pyridoxal phosphate enzyme (YggS family)
MSIPAPTPIDPRVVAEHVAAVRERIARAGGRDVALVAVTKTFGSDAVDAAVAAGCDGIGENYAQELLAKWPLVRSVPTPPLHFIGRLQSNKVRQLAPIVTVWETVDRASLVDEIARRAPGAAVLVQVNVTGEPDKGGCPPEQLDALVQRAVDAGLALRGLMCVGPTDEDPIRTRAAFARTRALCDALALPVCSMGMTDDLEIAVAEGSTQVRVGTALFGHRAPRATG